MFVDYILKYERANGYTRFLLLTQNPDLPIIITNLISMPINLSAENHTVDIVPVNMRKTTLFIKTHFDNHKTESSPFDFI